MNSAGIITASRGSQNIYLFYDNQNIEAIDYARSLKDELWTRWKNPLAASIKELVVAIGGDGTMLAAKETYWKSGIPILGLNFGHKGFLMNDPPEDPAETVSRILAGQFQLYRFPLLKIETDEGIFFALNDVAIRTISGQCCKLHIKVNGVVIAERFMGDGVVISTPLGSTGYLIAAGGSAVHPDIPAVGFAPITRLSPIQILPMVFPLESEFEITVLNHPKDTRGWADGFEVLYSKRIKVTAGSYWIKLAFWEGENFTERLVRKIMKVQEA